MSRHPQAVSSSLLEIPAQRTPWAILLRALRELTPTPVAVAAPPEYRAGRAASKGLRAELRRIKVPTPVWPAAIDAAAYKEPKTTGRAARVRVPIVETPVVPKRADVLGRSHAFVVRAPPRAILGPLAVARP